VGRKVLSRVADAAALTVLKLLASADTTESAADAMKGLLAGIVVIEAAGRAEVLGETAAALDASL
jgi:hypothetical protein